MYKALVRRRVLTSFDALSRGEYTVAFEGLADDVHYAFAGDQLLLSQTTQH
jgi:ketosteroid isomerase-like protein